MTERAEKRMVWYFIFCCGLAMVALPTLVTVTRFAVIDLAAGGTMMAVSVWRLWTLRRRLRREPWNPKT